MKVNATKLRAHLNEDRVSVKNREEIAELDSSKQGKKKELDQLVGILPPLSEKDAKEIKEERVSRL